MTPLDSGPIYRETVMGRLPVEPWNTYSNVVFLLVVVYWAWRVYPRMSRHRFLALVLPVMFLCFLGGTLFHGTRSHELWLLMDWVPILFLCLACTILFARRVGLSWAVLAPLLALPFVLRHLMLNSWHWSPFAVMNAGYAWLGAIVLLPIVAHLSRNAWHRWPWMAAATLCFGLALTFRSLDHSSLFQDLPMGTHWLWHVFGGVAAHFVLGYIWADGLRRSTDPAGPAPP